MTTRKTAYVAMIVLGIFLIGKGISFMSSFSESIVYDMKAGGGISSINKAERIQLAQLNKEN